MTNLQTLTLDQLSTISGGRGDGSGAPASGTYGPPDPSTTSTGSTTSGAAPSSSRSSAGSTNIDLTALARSGNTWNVRGSVDHQFTPSFSANAYVQGGQTNGRQDNQVGIGLHWRLGGN